MNSSVFPTISRKHRYKANKDTVKVVFEMPRELMTALIPCLFEKRVTVQEYISELIHASVSELGLGDYSFMLSSETEALFSNHIRDRYQQRSKWNHIKLVSFNDYYSDQEDLPQGAAPSPVFDHAPINPVAKPTDKLRTEIDKAAEGLVRLRNLKRYASIYSPLKKLTKEEARAEIYEVLQCLPHYMAEPLEGWVSLQGMQYVLRKYVKRCKEELEALLALQDEPMPPSMRKALVNKEYNKRLKEEQSILTQAYVHHYEKPKTYPLWAGELVDDSRLSDAFNLPKCRNRIFDNPRTKGPVLRELMEQILAREMHEREAYVENTEIRDPTAHVVALDLALMPVTKIEKYTTAHRKGGAGLTKKPSVKPPAPKGGRPKREEPVIYRYNFEYKPVTFKWNGTDPYLQRSSYVEEDRAVYSEQPEQPSRREQGEGDAD